MIKITAINVTKVAESVLYQVLETLKPSDPTYVLIEAELDRRLECEARLIQRRHAAQLESLKLTHAIELEIKSIFSSYKGKKTLKLIENLGQEYVDDYSICEVTFTVKSHVDRRFNEDQNDTWYHDNMKSAEAKKVKLIYDRIYNKWMRNPTQDNVELLQRLLGEVCSKAS